MKFRSISPALAKLALVSVAGAAPAAPRSKNDNVVPPLLPVKTN